MADDYTANTTTTGSLAVGGSTTGVIDSNGDYDWLKMSLTGGKVYRVDVTSSNAALVNPAIDGIYTAAGNVVAGTLNDDYFNTTDARAYFAPAVSATYYASIYNSYYYGTGGYTATLTEVTPGASDYTPSFAFGSLSSTSTAEGGSLNFYIQRLGNTSTAVNVSWSIAGSGSYPVDAADFYSSVLPGGSLFFGANVIEKLVTVYTNDDVIYEGNETFTLTVTPQAGGQESPVSSTVTILNNDQAPVISFAADPVQEKGEGPSATTTYTFTVIRTGDLYLPSTVSWAVTGSGVNAANGADFVGGILPSGTLTFAANEATQTITVNVQGDDSFEQNEGFAVTLSNPAMATLAMPISAAATIINDDVAYTVTSPASPVKEGNSGSTTYTFTVKSHYNVSDGSTLNWNVTGSGADKDDFVGGVLPTGSLVFAAGEDTKTITVNVQGDTTIETDEAFTLTLSPPNGEWAQITEGGAILDDDSDYVITPATVVKDEGNSGTTAYTFNVRSNYNVSTGSTATWAVDGNSTNPASASDFVGGVLPTGSLVFAANEDTKTVTVNVQGDTDIEQNEGFKVTLTTPGSRQPLPAEGTITDDDTGLSVAISGTPPAAEGNSGSTPYTFTVARTGALASVSTVNWAVSGSGTNLAGGADFVGGALPSGTLTFAANETTKTITVDVQGDTAVEEDETFTVTLSNPSGATLITPAASGTIKNDDTGLTIAASGTPPAAEGNSITTPYTFTVTRSGVSTGSSTVNWAVSGSGTNQANATDFVGGVLPSGTLTFAANETTKTITVDVQGDTAVEEDEAFTVTLSNPSGATLITPAASGTIKNDDTGLTIAASGTPPAAEGNSVTTPYTFTVTRSGVSTGSSTVNWAVSGSGTNQANATDFVGGVLPSGTLTFAANETTKTVTVNVQGDASIESDETFTVTLSNPSGATLAASSSAVETIKNDDFAYTITSPGSPSEGNSGTTAYTFAVTSNYNVSSGSTATWAITGSGTNAANAADFENGAFPSGTITFASGETSKNITVYVQGDTTFEPNEEFTLTLTPPQGGGQPTLATAIITNDDMNSVTASNSKVFMSSSAAETFVVANSGITLYGSSAREVVSIVVGATAVTIDQNIDRVNLTGAVGAYTFKQSGSSLLLYEATGTTAVVTIPLQMDADGTQVAFDGSAYDAKLDLTTGAVSVGGATVSAATAASITPVTPTATVEPTPAALSSAKVYMANTDQFTAASSGTTIYGNTGVETVTITATTTDISFDQNIEEIIIAGTLSDYTFKQTGNKINIYEPTGSTLIASGAVQSDADGTMLSFANNGAGSVIMSSTTGVMTLGGATVSTTTPAAVTTLSSGIVVTGTGSRDASFADQIFSILNAGTYTYTISGFGTGDKLIFPSGAAPTVSNSDLADGIVDLLYTTAGQTTTIRLTGISTANDAALGTDIGNFATVPGVGTIA